MNAVTKKGTSSFTPRARLLKLLGGELIKDDVMAVVEVVKNAHDADASTVTLEFMDTSLDCGEIIVRDDGDGLTLNSLLGNWMQPAGSEKNHKDKKYTRLGRRSLGEKGVGRFAVDRLGSKLELISRARGSKKEIVANFDWDLFDDDSRLLSEVETAWTERPATAFKKPGTMLRISGLRKSWSERDFRKLTSRLRRLLSPFSRNDSFEIKIESNEFPDYSSLLDQSFLESSPYRVEARYDGGDMIKIYHQDRKPVTCRWNGMKELTCGPCRIVVHSFDLDGESLSRVGPNMQVRAWLKDWSGISIYRDDFRVLPYGEPDDDWLRLDQRRVNTPVLRLSNNQVCGFIEIEGDKNPELRDQTNRGGLIQNRAFEDLRRLTVFTMEKLEHDRQKTRIAHNIARAAMDPEAAISDKASEDSLELLARESKDLSGKKGQRIRVLLKNLQKREKREAANKKILNELAFIGLASSVSQRMIQRHLKPLSKQVADLISKGPDNVLVSEHIKSLEAASNVAHLPFDLRGVRQLVEIQDEILIFHSNVAALLAHYEVSFDLRLDRKSLLRVSCPSRILHAALHVLLENSLEWLADTPDAEISISIRSDDRFCHIDFQDNGPGISDDHADHIFEPGWSGLHGGRGMGLTLAREVLNDYGARLQLKRRRRRTTFTVSFQRRRLTRT